MRAVPARLALPLSAAAMCLSNISVTILFACLIGSDRARGWTGLRRDKFCPNPALRIAPVAAVCS